MRLVPLVLLACLPLNAPWAQGVDLSGSWTFDGPKSMRVPGPDGRVVLSAMLGIGSSPARTVRRSRS